MFAKAENLLARSGSHKSRLLMVNILLLKLSDWEAMNSVWDVWIDSKNPPCRYSYGGAEIGGPEPGWLVERKRSLAYVIDMALIEARQPR